MRSTLLFIIRGKNEKEEKKAEGRKEEGRVEKVCAKLIISIGR